MNKCTKESGTINLATLLLVFVIIVVIIICSIVAIRVSRRNSNKVSNNLNEEPKSIEDYQKIAKEYENFKKLISDYEGEEFVNTILSFDNPYDIIDVSNSSYDDSYVNNFSEDEINELLEKYINIFNLYEYNIEQLLINFNLVTQEKLGEYKSNKLILDEFYETDINYEDFKNEMLKYMTEEMFIKNFSEDVKSLKGKLCYSMYNIGEDESFKILSIEKNDDNNYIVDFHVISNDKDNDIDDVDYSDTDNNHDTNEDEDINTDIENTDNENEDDNLNQEEFSEYDDEMIIRITSRNKKPIVAY